MDDGGTDDESWMTVMDREGIWLVGSPDEQLDYIVGMLGDCHLVDDANRIDRLGAGPLETLMLFGHEDELWDRIEHLARTDPKFRRALASVWGYRSPRFDDRARLLEELGEPTGPGRS
ncbi:MAG: hypothetical protein JWN46_135 [Acidimicrobiales bacterium]|nr:hypothetical protein [Acidimicrobiales bacterium]